MILLILHILHHVGVSYKRHLKPVHTFSHKVALGPKYIQKLFKRAMVGIAQNKLGSKLIFLSGLPQPGSDCGLRPHTFNIFASAAFIYRPYMQDTEIRYTLRVGAYLERDILYKIASLCSGHKLEE